MTKSPLCIAIRERNFEKILELVHQGCKVNDIFGFSACGVSRLWHIVSWCPQHFSYDQIKEVICAAKANGEDLNSAESAYNPLAYPIIIGDPHYLNLLLDLGLSDNRPRSREVSASDLLLKNKYWFEPWLVAKFEAAIQKKS